MRGIFAIIVISNGLIGENMGIRILGTGSYLPPKVVTNDDIAAALDTSDEWIYSHTGIHARHVAEEGETTSTMAAKAAKAALEMAGVSPEEIGRRRLTTPPFHPRPALYRTCLAA